MRTFSSVVGVLLLVVGLAAGSGVPVYLMLPLTAVTSSGVSDPAQLKADLAKIKAGGLAGVMVDVWWGLVEPASKQYNFSAYRTLAELVAGAGLKLQPVMSFHRCGGNVGDTCDVPLPQWVRSAGTFYTDREGHANEEYVSLGADAQAVFAGGRTALQLYGDLMAAFAREFSDMLGGTIDMVMVGLGPASELRYPSYPSAYWSYCGVGEFECYDKFMLAQLKDAAASAGHSEWGNGGPNNAGTYNSRPSDTGFFGSGSDNYASAYGQFFLSWYNEVLLQHAVNVLKLAQTAFASKVPLGVKVSGIHWWYSDASHASELTAGYYNANGHNAYLTIAQAVKPYASVFDFTCFEMTDSGGENCGSKPVELVQQAASSAHSAGMQFDGENALELCNPNCYQGGFDQIVSQASANKIQHFTYLRLTRNLLDNSANWNIFTNFVSRMKGL